MTYGDDAEVWSAFIAALKPKQSAPEKRKRSPFQSSNNEVVFLDQEEGDQQWIDLMNGLDAVNKKRYEYVLRQHPLKIRKKQTYQPTCHNSPYAFNPLPSDEEVIELDRSEKKSFYKLMSNQIITLDLHGYTLITAYDLLLRAVDQAIRKHLKVLKVITGKGRSTPNERNPTLRFMFPHWMRDSYFKPRIIKVRLAPKEHGGNGAFLVYLRNNKDYKSI